MLMTGFWCTFPVKKTGQTYKFTSFWRGPFEVIEILTEVLLKINCGRNGAVATIHIDRVVKSEIKF